MSDIEISVVVPAYNEEENIFPMYKAVTEVLGPLGKPYEIIYVDDGSTDRTVEELKKVCAKDKHVKAVIFRKNFGQTAAMDAGFKQAQGRVIFPMDADLQNDPKDIPRLLKKLDEGYDVVSGWRKNRRDTFFKKFVSRGANLLRKLIINDKIHDSGCTLKAYKKKCFEGITLYGEMHRFIPAILEWKGYKVTELVVRHHSRKYGQTKYGMKRTIKGFLDMLVMKFWMQYSTRPIHLFGSSGLLMTFFGILIGAYLAFIKIFFGASIGNRPLLILSVLLMVLGVQLIMFGFLADILVKVYYRDVPNYSVEKVIN
ncbi:MAG: glycosyltransferase family 2 protein [archaeon]